MRSAIVLDLIAVYENISEIFHDYVLPPMLFLERFANNDLYIPVSSRFTGSTVAW